MADKMEVTSDSGSSSSAGTAARVESSVDEVAAGPLVSTSAPAVVSSSSERASSSAMAVESSEASSLLAVDSSSSSASTPRTAVAQSAKLEFPAIAFPDPSSSASFSFFERKVSDPAVAEFPPLSPHSSFQRAWTADSNAPSSPNTIERRQLQEQNADEGLLLMMGCGMFGLMAGAQNDVEKKEGNVYEPTVVPALQSNDIRQISLSACHALAASGSGVAYSWGDNSYGQLGQGDREPRYRPQQISALDVKTVKSVSAGYAHSAFVTDSAEVLNCGNGESGQLGLSLSIAQTIDLDLSDHAIPSLCKQFRMLHTSIVKVSCGERHTLALSDQGNMFVCGDGNTHALGLEEGKHWTKEKPRIPIFVALTQLQPMPIVDIAAGPNHSLALSALGSVYAWGQGKRGQTGHGHSSITNVPRRVEALQSKNVVGISAGNQFSACFTVNGELYTFGANDHGQLGVGDRENYFLPKRVDQLVAEKVVSVSCGLTHALASTSRHHVYVFGSGEMGQLGLGSSEEKKQDQLTPVRLRSSLLESRPILGICAGSDTSAVIVGRERVNAEQLKKLTAERMDITTHSLSGTATSSDSNSSASEFPSSVTAADMAIEKNGVRLISGMASLPLLGPLRSLIPVRPHTLRTFDLAEFSSTINECRKNSDYSAALAVVSYFFSSPSLLNASFLPGDTHGIAFDSVEHTYKVLLTEVKQQQRIFTIFTSALQKCVSQLLAWVKSAPPIHDARAYRCLLIILQAPHLSEAGQSECSLIHDIAQIFKRLPAQVLATFKLWLTHYSKEVFATRLVKNLTSLVNQRLKAAKTTFIQSNVHPSQWEVAQAQVRLKAFPEEIPSAIELLSFLFEANAEADKAIVEEAHFHCEAIGTCVDFASDYLTWYQTLAATPEFQNGAPTPKTAPAAAASSASSSSSTSSSTASASASSLPAFSMSSGYRYVKPPSSAAFAFCFHPYVLTPLTKTMILRIENYFAQKDAARTAVENAMLHAMLSPSLQQQQEINPYLVLNIHRDRVVDDAVYAVNRFPPIELRRPLKIKFVGEEGIDEGGLSQEFFRLVISGLMQEAYGLFKYNPETRQFWYNLGEVDPSKESLYYIAGAIVGLALYNGAALEVNFPLVIYRQLLGQQLTLEDIKSFDPQLANSLLNLINYEGDLADLCLSFSITQAKYVDPRHTSKSPPLNAAIAPASPTATAASSSSSSSSTSPSPSVEVIELVAGGADIPVTRENLKEYIHRYAEYKVNQSVRRQALAFTRGFRSICVGAAMKLFQAKDLELVLAGSPVLDFRELEKSARYDGGYSSDHPVIRDFWSAVHEDLTDDERRQLLLFVTGSDRAPLGGLGSLRITIQRQGPDSALVPTASTCFSVLLLPEYSSKAKLVRKLRAAIAHAEGFGLQ